MNVAPSGFRLRAAAAAATQLLLKSNLATRTPNRLTSLTSTQGRFVTAGISSAVSSTSRTSSRTARLSGSMSEPAAKRAKVHTEANGYDSDDREKPTPQGSESPEQASTASPGRRRRKPLADSAAGTPKTPEAAADPADAAAAPASAAVPSVSEPSGAAANADPAAAVTLAQSEPASAPPAATAAPAVANSTAAADAAATDSKAASGAAAANSKTAAVQPATSDVAAVSQPAQGLSQAGQQQAQQQRQHPQQQQQQEHELGRKGKKKNWTPHLSTFHQCVKRELPYEAMHVYQKIKEAQPGKLDLATCNGLLNVAVGNWQWELHLRHQHLLRQYNAEGRDTSDLQGIFDTYLAAERERMGGWQEQTEEGTENMVVDDDIPQGTPPSMVCHITRATSDKSCKPEELKSRTGLPGAEVLADMPAVQKPFTELLRDILELVRTDLEAFGSEPDEQLLMGLARVAAITGDPDKAFEYAMQVTTAGGARAVIPRLRDFQPALVGYALTGQAGKSHEVVQCMMEHCKPGDMTECEFALWLEAIAAGGSYEQLVEALQLMGQELNQLKPRTLALVQRFFESDRAAAALAAGGAVVQDTPSSWQQQWVEPDDKGHVAAADATLSLADLTETDWQLFDEQVFKLGTSNESTPGQFERFRAWFDEHGPFDITVDGANLAFYGENYVGGSFKCWKVKVAYDTMMKQHPNDKILLVLHEGRFQQTRREDPDTFAWLECLRSQNLLYVTPKNMNDDLFWMYATIRGRAGSRLLSNDQMRDHVWSMLRPKHMLKWKARHVITYNYNFDKSCFFAAEPKPFTPCVQQVRPGVWLLPSVVDNRWLLCQPRPN